MFHSLLFQRRKKCKILPINENNKNKSLIISRKLSNINLFSKTKCNTNYKLHLEKINYLDIENDIVI